MSSASPKLGYPDLDDPSVYEGLVGYGMFDEQLPPCFTSEGLLRVKNITKPEKQPYFPIQYYASRYNHGVRTISIPHPEPYLYLCDQIRENWQMINTHIGKPNTPFSRVHARKVKGEKCIFKMNYGSQRPDEHELEYRLNCTHVVKADISNCFPSIYAHSINWAVHSDQPRYRRRSTNKKVNWTEKLDKACRDLNSQRTVGLLIGPHSSYIISELILTAIDYELQDKNFKKVVRRIDDYTFYAKNEPEAERFLNQLNLSLRGYELNLNMNKTKITPAKEYYDSRWTDELKQHKFAITKSRPIGFSTVNAFIELALELCRKEAILSPLKYATRVVLGKELDDEAKRMYVKKMLALANLHPYLLPALESHVLHPYLPQTGDLKDFALSFSEALIKRGLQNSFTDALAFGFYFAIKYDLRIERSDYADVIDTGDCIAMTLAYEYARRRNENLNQFHKRASELCQSQDESLTGRYWLFIYQVIAGGEYAYLENTDEYLIELNDIGVQFLVF